MNLKHYLRFTALTSILALSACGGSSETDTSSVVQEGEGSILQLEDNLQINQSVDLVLFFPNDVITNIVWQQTSGAAIDVYAKNSKVIGFTPIVAGNYGFEVSFVKNNGARQTISTSFTVTDTASLISARLAHEVRSGNKVSLRAQIDANIDERLITWQQVEGPTASLTSSLVSGELAIFFDAPLVSKDTFISFEAAVTVDGTQHTDIVTILVEAANTIDENAYFETRVATVFPYNDNSPYKDSLTNCVYSNTLTSSCTLSNLPLIAQEVQNSTATPAIEDIMDRVVVSHQWMGDRFKEFLLNNDPSNDFKNLLRATTAIVISYDIRPSFYWVATGAIYLDANNFWQLAQERDTINEAPDFRASFGNELQFVMPWRYVKDNDYASSSVPSSVRFNRDANAAIYRITSLMYHELAHANDFFPSNEWYIHSPQTRILDAGTSSNFESDQLAISLPLKSQTMRDLAQVSFAGVDANSLQKSYLPSDIEGIFSSDLATDYYAYSSLREDYAMLFEELMMQTRYNVFRDVAVTNRPTGDDVSANDYIVTWGQRGRIGESTIKPRVLFSASRVLPEFESAAAIDNTPAPIAMITGEDWITNLVISPTTINTIKSKNRSLKTKVVPKLDTNRYYHKALPKH